jgi:hypothetical protein
MGITSRPPAALGCDRPPLEPTIDQAAADV